MKDQLIVVSGAGGFIGGNLVASLRQQGHSHIRAVDVKPLEHWYRKFNDVENLILDLNDKENCEIATKGATEVYNLAANMGGMGFIEKNKALCMLSVLINTHMLMAAQKCGVERYFYSSSACVYNGDLQHTRDEGNRFTPPALKESDAYPALAEDGYGWEKLFLSGCAATSWRTSACMCVWLVSTTSTDRGEHGSVAVKRPRRRFAVK